VARVLPAGGGGWAAQRRTEQEAVLAGLADVAPVRELAEAPTTPGDVDALLALVPDLDLSGPRPADRPLSERLDGTWRLTVPLPFAERGGVELTRWADDLVLTTGGLRRSLRLDALLRRCEVTGGRLSDAGTAAARLEVTFAPDRRLWPADLLPAEESAP
jgi:arsenite-transporting ATPase